MMLLRRFSTSIMLLKEVADLSINPLLKQAMVDAKFTLLTPVQELAIEPAIKENGLVVRAKTGTGKTLAFVMPTLHEVLKDNGARAKNVQALVISPTRDLAMQIDAEFEKIISALPRLKQPTTGLAIGGKPTRFNPRYPPQVVVGTPGRINHILQDPKIRDAFQQLKFRVYDEADLLLESGFEEELHNINRNLPEGFKLLLYLATINDKVDGFAKKVIDRDYLFIDCTDASETEAHERIHQTVVVTESVAETYEKAASYAIKKMESPGFKAIMFVLTKSSVAALGDIMENARDLEIYDTRKAHRENGAHVWKLLSDFSQPKRDRVVREFKKAKLGVLISTSVAARGMDFSGVTDVILVGPSPDVAEYVHKIGRTARAGTDGNSVLFISRNEAGYLNKLKRERGIEFNARLFGEDIESLDNFWPLVALRDRTTADAAGKAMMGAYNSMVGAYRMDAEEQFRDMAEFHKLLLNDSEAKIKLGNTVWNMMQIHPRVKEELFERDQPRDGWNSRRTDRLRQSKRNTFNDYGRGNDRFGDRRGNYRSRGSRNDDGEPQFRNRSVRDRLFD